MPLKLQPPQSLAFKFAELAALSAELRGDWHPSAADPFANVPPEDRHRVAGYRVAFGGTEIHVVHCIVSEELAAAMSTGGEALAAAIPVVVGWLEKQPLPEGFEVVHMYPSRRMAEELEL
jgi:hypothetical protein